MQRLNDMPTSELITTARNYSASIKEIGVYSELVKQLTDRLALSTAATSQALTERADLRREVTAYEATATNLEAQVQGLAAENGRLKTGAKFFMYSEETGFELHPTQEAAIASAEDMIGVCREEAASDGWPEETDTICWGIIVQKAVEGQFEKPSEKNGWIGWSEYSLSTFIETPATDAALAEIRAQGVDLAIERLAKKFEGTGGVGVPVMALEHLASELRKEQGK